MNFGDNEDEGQAEISETMVHVLVLKHGEGTDQIRDHAQTKSTVQQQGRKKKHDDENDDDNHKYNESETDESNWCEAAQGENWLRLVRKDTHSVLDNTQTQHATQSQSSHDPEDAVVYPTIVSVSNVGDVHYPTEDCFICIDVDGSLLAIKDMRLLSATTNNSITATLETQMSIQENEPPEPPKERPLGILCAGKSQWETLPRRQIKLLHHGDKICTALDLENASAGLVMEYRYAPKPKDATRPSSRQGNNANVLSETRTLDILHKPYTQEEEEVSYDMTQTQEEEESLSTRSQQLQKQLPSTQASETAPSQAGCTPLTQKLATQEQSGTSTIPLSQASHVNGGFTNMYNDHDDMEGYNDDDDDQGEEAQKQAANDDDDDDDDEEEEEDFDMTQKMADPTHQVDNNEDQDMADADGDDPNASDTAAKNPEDPSDPVQRTSTATASASKDGIDSNIEGKKKERSVETDGPLPGKLSTRPESKNDSDDETVVEDESDAVRNDDITKTESKAAPDETTAAIGNKHAEEEQYEQKMRPTPDTVRNSLTSGPRKARQDIQSPNLLEGSTQQSRTQTQEEQQINTNDGDESASVAKHGARSAGSDSLVLPCVAAPMDGKSQLPHDTKEPVASPILLDGGEDTQIVEGTQVESMDQTIVPKSATQSSTCAVGELTQPSELQQPASQGVGDNADAASESHQPESTSISLSLRRETGEDILESMGSQGTQKTSQKTTQNTTAAVGKASPFNERLVVHGFRDVKGPKTASLLEKTASGLKAQEIPPSSAAKTSGPALDTGSLPEGGSVSSPKAQPVAEQQINLNSNPAFLQETCPQNDMEKEPSLGSIAMDIVDDQPSSPSGARSGTGFSATKAAVSENGVEGASGDCVEVEAMLPVNNGDDETPEMAATVNSQSIMDDELKESDIPAIEDHESSSQLVAAKENCQRVNERACQLSKQSETQESIESGYMMVHPEEDEKGPSGTGLSFPAYESQPFVGIRAQRKRSGKTYSRRGSSEDGFTFAAPPQDTEDYDDHEARVQDAADEDKKRVADSVTLEGYSTSAEKERKGVSGDDKMDEKKAQAGQASEEIKPNEMSRKRTIHSLDEKEIESPQTSEQDTAAAVASIATATAAKRPPRPVRSKKVRTAASADKDPSEEELNDPDDEAGLDETEMNATNTTSPANTKGRADRTPRYTRKKHVKGETAPSSLDVPEAAVIQKRTSRQVANTPVATTPNGRKGKSATGLSVQIMTTGVEIGAEEKKWVKAIGGTLLEKLDDAASATHLIISKEVKRTPKLMIAMCTTGDIVSMDWLKDSAKEKKPLPTEKYLLLKGITAEKQYCFKMRESLSRAGNMRSRGEALLRGYSVYLTKGVAGNTAKDNRTPSPKEFKLILQAAGATVLSVLPTKKDLSDTIIVVSKVRKEAEKQEAARGVAAAMERGAFSVSTEDIFRALMTQEFKP